MNQPDNAIHEQARETPVVRTVDVVVCGGGPAGVCAALAAAREGASVALLEVHGCLGGIWTAGCLSWIIDAGNKQGIMREILVKLFERDALTPGTPGRGGPSRADLRGDHYVNSYDPEAMKLLLEELCLEAGIHVRLHTRVVDAHVEGGRLTHVLSESKSGREAWAGHCFVDCTGDGDLGALAGCGFDLGEPETGRTQPFSLICMVGGIELTEVEPFVTGWTQGDQPPKERLLAELQRAGVEPSYAWPSLFRVRDDLFALMANHEYGCLALRSDEVTQATLRARAEVHRLVDALRRLGPPWQNFRIVATAEQIGVREGRRLHGRYTVSRDDLANGTHHDDAVARVTAEVDIHALTGEGHDKRATLESVSPYDIPLRALQARDVDGLLMAGRCISGDFVAHASYRVTGNAAATGEAAGRLAASCAASFPDEDSSPHGSGAAGPEDTGIHPEQGCAEQAHSGDAEGAPDG